MSTREKILDVAGKLFAQNGYDGTSVRDITNAADVNLGAITYHFGSKLDLFGEVIQVKTEPLRELGQRIIESNDGPEEKIKYMLEGLAMHILHTDPDLKVFFVETLSGGDRFPPGVNESVEGRNAIFRSLLEEGIEKGIFRECDLENAPWCFFGMLSAYTLYEPIVAKEGRRGSFSKEYVREIVDAIYNIFMYGIRVKS